MQTMTEEILINIILFGIIGFFTILLLLPPKESTRKDKKPTLWNRISDKFGRNYTYIITVYMTIYDSQDEIIFDGFSDGCISFRAPPKEWEDFNYAKDAITRRTCEDMNFDIEKISVVSHIIFFGKI